MAKGGLPKKPARQGMQVSLTAIRGWLRVLPGRLRLAQGCRALRRQELPRPELPRQELLHQGLLRWALWRLAL